MMICHTNTVMPKLKVAITVDSKLLDELDRLVARKRFANRSQAIEAAIGAHLEGLSRGRLARECEKLDPLDERSLANEGWDGEAEWPEY
jgi:Arc/MetJ-type ribon-helix-helix transcriptional regulator